MDERHTKNVSLFRTRIGPLIGALGGALMVMSLWTPLFLVSSPSSPQDPSTSYPPTVSGWQTISFFWNLASGKPYASLTTVAPVVLFWLLLAVVILSTSLFTLLRGDALPLATARWIAISAGIAALGGFFLSLVYVNLQWSPDAAAASPHFSQGPGFWLLLLGTALSVIGGGKVSVGAMLGAFCGLFIGPYLPLLFEALPGGNPFLNWLGFPLNGIFLNACFIGLALLGSLLGGWLFLRRQTRLYRARTVIHPRE